MDHQTELESIKAEADAKLEMLQDKLHAISTELANAQNECVLKTKALDDLKAEAVANDRIAAAKENEIQCLTEDNSAQAQSILQLEQSLTTLRNELTEESILKIQNLRTQMSRSHAQEIDLLKSRHESHLREAADLALEREQLAVDSAVTRVKLEFETKLSRQLDASNRDLQSTKAEITAEVVSLRKERDALKLIADEVPTLRQNIKYQSEKERELAEEITDLESHNRQLHGDLLNAGQLLDDLTIKTEVLEGEIKLGNKQIRSLESDLSSVKHSSSRELESAALQLRDQQAEISKLELALSQHKSSAVALNDRVEEMQRENLELSKFKEFTERSASTIADLNADVALCKQDAQEMIHLFSSSFEELVLQMKRREWKLEEGTNVLKGELSRLLSELDDSERANAVLVEKIACIEAAARDADATLSEERLSWKQSMENMKVEMSNEKLSWEKAREAIKAIHAKEQVMLCCRAQDEQDILNNQIVMLQDKIRKQQERNVCQRQILEAESARKVEALNATISKIKYEDAAEIQELEKVKSSLTKSLEDKEHQCNMLSQQIESTRLKHRAEVERLQREVETASHNHKLELDGHLRTHEDKVSSLEDEVQNLACVLQRVEEEKECYAKEKECYATHVRTQLTTGRDTVVLEAIVCVKNELNILRALSNDHVVEFRQELGKLVLILKQRFKSRLKEYLDEISRLVQSHSEALAQLKEKCHQRVALVQKDLRDTKQILFQTVQESEMKLESTKRRLEEEHQVQLKAVANKKTTDLIDALSKVKSLSKECEALAKKHALTTDEVVQRDTKIASHDEEISALKLTHKKEHRRLLRDALAKETSLMDQFAKERLELKAKLLAAKEENLKIHEKYVNNEGVHEQIRELQKQLHLMEVSEQEAKDKLLRFQQQMEMEKKRNSETSTVLRAIQSTRRSPSKADLSSLLPRNHRQKKHQARSVSKSLR